jgi:hypothetical protein
MDACLLMLLEQKLKSFQWSEKPREIEISVAEGKLINWH